MKIITGSYNKTTGAYKMHSPDFPYNDTRVYIGYSLTAMKKQYRKDFNLRYKHIDWIIV